MQNNRKIFKDFRIPSQTIDSNPIVREEKNTDKFMNGITQPDIDKISSKPTVDDFSATLHNNGAAVLPLVERLLIQVRVQGRKEVFRELSKIYELIFGDAFPVDFRKMGKLYQLCGDNAETMVVFLLKSATAIERAQGRNYQEWLIARLQLQLKSQNKTNGTSRISEDDDPIWIERLNQLKKK